MAPGADGFGVPATVGQWIDAPARLGPHRPAIVAAERTVTYGELDAWADRLARALLARGLAPGDRVATLTENSVEHVVVLFACARAGLILAPLNWHLSDDELSTQLALFAPALVLVSAARWDERVRGALAAAGPEPLEEFVAGASPPEGEPLAAPDGEAGLLLIATSGTTGTPKGALLTHRTCYWTNASLHAVMPIGPEDVVLSLLPQYHVGGWNIQTLLAWSQGATVVLEPAFDPGTVLEVIQRRRVTAMMGVPTMYVMLAEHPDFERADLSSLRAALVGGAAMPCATRERWAQRGVAMALGYGLTEAGPNTLILPPGQDAAHAGSVGEPYPYVEVALRDPLDGRLVEGAGRGEIVVRGPNLFAGYWRDPAATAAAVHDGWLRTGDIAERDADGYYRISGRTKEMFVSGGENVFPVEIERVLSEHPAVADVAVVSAPDARWGEVGVAYVVPHRDVTVEPEALVAFCREHLAHFKVPQRIVVTDELPRTPVGKIDKRFLARRAEEGGGAPG